MVRPTTAILFRFILTSLQPYVHFTLEICLARCLKGTIIAANKAYLMTQPCPPPWPDESHIMSMEDYITFRDETTYALSCHFAYKFYLNLVEALRDNVKTMEAFRSSLHAAFSTRANCHTFFTWGFRGRTILHCFETSTLHHTECSSRGSLSPHVRTFPPHHTTQYHRKYHSRGLPFKTSSCPNEG